MIRRVIRRPVVSIVGAMVVVVAAFGIVQLALAWWMGLPPLLHDGIGVVGVVLVVAVVDRLVHRLLRISPIGVLLGIVAFMAGIDRTSEEDDGRRRFESGVIDRLVRVLGRSDDSKVPVDKVMKRDPEGPAHPVLDLATHISIYGQTGVGKSTFIMAMLALWGLGEPIIAHAISQPDGTNEFTEFFRSKDAEVITISSRDSDARWDPFLDAGENVRDMENIAGRIFSSREIKVTGWSESVRSMLVAAVIVTNAEYGDFARLPDVLEEGPHAIIEKIDRVESAELVAAPLEGLDDSERNTVYTNLLNRIRPLLMSEIFDDDLPRISLTEYFQDCGDRVIVLDNLSGDDFAAGFWRFFLERSFEIARDAEGRQQFVLDEVPTLPKIRNLKNMVSEARSEGVRAMIVAQDAHQMQDTYGDMKNSIWANSPNSVMFRAGDAETANLAIETLGEVELLKKTVSTNSENETTTTTSKVPGAPLLSGELTNMGVGEALIDTKDGWWLCKIEEQDP
ncbi:type IV secretory system conjugative DNA transfer family protein [Halococcus sp. IIIV-5B]|uniref:type IV secretory system conjugative DNA transfer family protein n=1 Tax=Halococcus sp. IIIV-5B TaxID=2321230 RepID=UPI001314C202|nr:type IV secretion system DNA-binding domain-containing protein [Halococcus sp. IIIV-5B]